MEVFEDVQRVVSLAVLGEWLYWLDAGTNMVMKANKTSPRNTRVIVLDRLSDLVDIVAVDINQVQYIILANTF